MQCGIQGGPFREPLPGSAGVASRAPWIKQGSNTPEAFLISLESMYSTYCRYKASAAKAVA